MRWLVLLAALAASGWAGMQSLAPSRPPGPRVLSPPNVEASATCIDCHEEIVDSLSRAPHRLTLRSALDPLLQEKFAGREVELLGRRFLFERDQGRLFFRNTESESERRVSVDWIFGSGHHALTPVTLAETPDGKTTLTQLLATWFADGELGLTPGLDGLDQQPSLFGGYHSHEQALDCFGCHSTGLPIEAGVIDFEQAELGVSCGRCHLKTASHANSDGEQPTSPPWRELSALDSINRCGECHRRADEFTRDELTVDNALLIRFAPVGLSLSKCFLVPEPGRLDCLTCHNPHQAAAADEGYYRERCLDCHAADPRPDQNSAPKCSVEPLESNCLKCHMPKVDVSPHLRFTDHWIRVR